MEWPPKIIDAFSSAMDVYPPDRDGKSATIGRILDLVAREAVCRAALQNLSLEDAYRVPVTPLGTIVNKGIDGTRAVSINGSLWNDSVDRLYKFVRENAAFIIPPQYRGR